jgi:hypothetical protein
VLLVSGLYHRLRRIESANWLNTAVRKTWIPIAIVAVVFTVGGYAMQKMVPQADSIDDIVAVIRK